MKFLDENFRDWIFLLLKFFVPGIFAIKNFFSRFFPTFNMPAE